MIRVTDEYGFDIFINPLAVKSVRHAETKPHDWCTITFVDATACIVRGVHFAMLANEIAAYLPAPRASLIDGGAGGVPIYTDLSEGATFVRPAQDKGRAG